jgi:hypothetical protein
MRHVVATLYGMALSEGLLRLITDQPSEHNKAPTDSMGHASSDAIDEGLVRALEGSWHKVSSTHNLQVCCFQCRPLWPPPAA